MNNGNKEQQTDQLLRGIYRMCVNRDDCTDCPFYITKCSFGEPKPKAWFDEETIEAPVVRQTPKFFTSAASEQPKETAEIIELPKEKENESFELPKDDDKTDGTWLVSTTMGSLFTKYVYICSKCGYRKESFLSMTPMSYCPECEKRKANQNNQ